MSDEHRVGQRVSTHPATDAWMRGDRYGTVEKVARLLPIHGRGDRYGTRTVVYVRLDRSGRLLPFAPWDLIPEETTIELVDDCNV